MKNYQNNLPFISIIVPCRNEEKFIKKCLDSIIEQNYPEEKMEILVIDGISKDKTEKIVKEYPEQKLSIRLIDNPQKITPVAFNIGIKNAKGEIIIIMGSHSIYQKNYISKCVDTLIKYKADNVGGILRTMPNKNTISAKAIAICLSNFFGVGGSHFRKGLNKIVEVDTVFGGCYQKKIFEKIGLFNEKLIRSQDMEFNLRLKKAGGKIILNPEIVSYYYPKSTLKKFFKHNFIDGIWAIYPLKFVKIPLKIRHYMPLFFVLSLLITGLLGIFNYLFLWLFLSIIAFYVLLSLYFSINIAYDKKKLRYLSLMPITFACRHFGYGLGSLWGLITIFKKLKQKIMQKYIFYKGHANTMNVVNKKLDKNYYFKIWKPKIYKIAPRGLFSIIFFIYWICHYLKLFRNSFYSIYLIYYKNEIVHYSVVLPKFFKTPFMKKNDLQIGPIGTKKEHRRKGLAAYAIQEIIKSYKNPNKKIWYLTRKENIISGQVIEKFGFKAYGEGFRKGRLGIFNIKKIY